MNVSSVSRPYVVFAYRGMALNEAARVMREQHVGCLIVVEERDGGRWPVGVLTDRDIAISVVAKDLDPRGLTVGEVMNAELVAVHEDDSIPDALAAMRHRGVRRVPVVTRAGMLAGIVSVDDLLRTLVNELDAIVDVISSELSKETLERR